MIHSHNLLLYFFFFALRISVIFRVRSAKAVKITDASLIKKLGLLCGFVSVALLIRTLVSPPDVIVGRTADNLKAFLCKTDWWDHTFTSRKWCCWIPPKGDGFGFIDSFIVEFSFRFSRFSGSLVPGVGSEVVYSRSQSAIGIQRKPLYIDGNLQRVSSYLLSQRFNVSLRALGFALLIVCFHFFWICISQLLRLLYFLEDSLGTSNSRSNSQRRFMKSQSLRSFFFPRD